MARTRYQQDEICGGCVHFFRHYTKFSESCYLPTCFGHCTYPRIKERQMDEHCPHWTPIEGADPAEQP